MNYIARIISLFYKNRYPADLENEVQHWLISDTDFEEKDRILQEKWNQQEEIVNQETYEALSRVKARLGLSDEKKRFLWRNKQILKLVASIILPLLIIAGGYWSWKNYRSEEVAWVEIHVPYGEQQFLMLPDSSEVWMNAGTTIKYPKDFDKDSRTVRLDGEAYFSVKKEPERKFIVQTELLSVEVLGTKFNVKAYASENYATATLEEGSIAVSIHQEDSVLHYRLIPGQLLTYDKQTGVEIKNVQVDKASVRNGGYLVFNNKSLREIIQELEHYYNVSIVIHEDVNLNDNYSMKFTNGETIDRVMDVLQDAVGNFKYTIKKKGK